MAIYVRLPCLPGFMCRSFLTSFLKASTLFLCATFFPLIPISGPGYTPKDPHLSFSSILTILICYSFPRFSGPRYTPKGPCLLTDTSTSFPQGFLFSSGLSPPINTGALALPSLLLHVFVVHLQLLFDVMAINSRRYFHFDFADWWAFRPGLTQGASIKKIVCPRSIEFNEAAGRWSSCKCKSGIGKFTGVGEKRLWSKVSSVEFFVAVCGCWQTKAVEMKDSNHQVPEVRDSGNWGSGSESLGIAGSLQDFVSSDIFGNEGFGRSKQSETYLWLLNNFKVFVGSAMLRCHSMCF